MRVFIPLSEVYPSFDAGEPAYGEPYNYDLLQMGYIFKHATECTIAGWVLTSEKVPNNLEPRPGG